MTNPEYQRIVAAATAETQSKFRLAEALALDIPPHKSGPADENDSVTAYLEQAREAIAAAGGEARSIVTLREYRGTALWVRSGTTTNFQWIPGLGFWAHREAWRSGLTYEAFASNPTGAKQVSREFTDQRRAKSAASNLPPEQKAALADDLIDELPPERQAQIVGKWLAEPATADEVMQSPEARSHAMSAIDRKERQEFRKPPVLDSGPNPDPFRLLYDLRRVHRIMVDIAQQVSQRGTIVSAEEGDLVMEEIEWLTNSLSMIKSGISSGTLDDAIDRILAGDGQS